MANNGKLETVAARAGLSVRTYKTDDLPRRYAFFRTPAGGDPGAALSHFTPGAVFTAIGPREARAFLAGFHAARALAQRAGAVERRAPATETPAYGGGDIDDS